MFLGARSGYSEAISLTYQVLLLRNQRFTVIMAWQRSMTNIGRAGNRVAPHDAVAHVLHELPWGMGNEQTNGCGGQRCGASQRAMCIHGITFVERIALNNK